MKKESAALRRERIELKETFRPNVWARAERPSITQSISYIVIDMFAEKMSRKCAQLILNLKESSK